MWIADAAQVKRTQGKEGQGRNVSGSSGLRSQNILKEDAPEKTVSRNSDVQINAQDGATVAISAEGMGLARQNREEEQTAMQEAMERKMYQEMLERAKEASETQGEGFGDLAKALEIARRILNGDIVPRQDEQFLMEFNSEIYMRVKSMAKAKEDPEEYDTLLEEEEDEEGVRSKKTEESSGENSGDSVQIEAVEV